MSKPPARASRAKPPASPKPGAVFSRSSEDQETTQALSLPATYINAIYPMTQKGIVRLSFGEAVDGNTHFHSAVVMSKTVAEMLKDALTEALESLDADED